MPYAYIFSVTAGARGIRIIINQWDRKDSLGLHMAGDRVELWDFFQHSRKAIAPMLQKAYLE